MNDLSDEQVDAELSTAIWGYDPRDKYPEWSNERMREAYRAGREDALTELREARTIRTVEELDALPVGTVVRDSLPGDPVTCERQETYGDLRFENASEWFAVGDGTAAASVHLPARVIWHPDWEAW